MQAPSCFTRVVSTLPIGMAFLLIYLLSNQCSAEQDSAVRPNVLFIIVDDLNDWVGCYGRHPNANTPNIDRLATRGLRFTTAHSQAPICGPSRACLLTGLLPSTSGIYGQISDTQIKLASPSTKNVTLLPDYLEKHGYRSLACGKIFHNGDRAKVFDEYGGFASFGPKPQKRFQYDPAWFPEKIGTTQTDWGAYPETDDLMPDYKIAEFGVQQLEQEHSQPFFLALGFMRPHVPWYVPQKWFDLHPLSGVTLPPYNSRDFDDIPTMSQRVNALPAMPTTEWAIAENQWQPIVQSYLACTTFVDAQIGKVLDALQASRYMENTIVILCSDHGYHLGEKNRFCKQALWDRANRIPLIISTPEMPEELRNHTCDAPVGLVDLYPTILELCGLPANSANDGHSLQPLLRDPDHNWQYVTTTSYGPDNHAVQTRQYRFYQYEDGSMELYDHHDDINEWHNLAQRPTMQPVVERLAARLPKQPAQSSKLNKYPTNRYFQQRFP